MNYKSRITSYSTLTGIVFIALLLHVIGIFPDFLDDEQRFSVDVIVDTQGETINAVQGEILYADDSLQVKRINSGSSFVNLWIEKPQVTDGMIAFSGITPGGYYGDRGVIFSVTFETLGGGEDQIRVEDFVALLNDGSGTPADVQLSLVRSENKTEINTDAGVDSISPQSFSPEVVQRHRLFDNNAVLVFETQDKGSGIDRYEVKEVRFTFLRFLSAWQEASSPYLLRDQDLKSHIYVKAIDNAGNERIEIIAPAAASSEDASF
ncbi:MAG: hypothetical protein WD335_03195 [Candidatus Paceibacterota bacterium]